MWDMYEAEGGRVVAPAPWVRDRVNLPPRYAEAILHPDVGDRYKPLLLQTAQDYVRAFQPYGESPWLTLVGQSGTGKTHTAAAVANEIVANYTHGIQFTVCWLPVSWALGRLFNHRTFGQKEEFYALENKIMRSNLLVVDDLSHAAQFPMAKEYLWGVYDYRYQHQLPIVTTANAAVTADDWATFDAIMDPTFTRRVREQSRGFTCVV